MLKIERIIPSNLWQIYTNHKTVALCYHMLTAKLWKPSHIEVIISDMIGRRTKPLDNLTHCKSAMEWIFRAQDMSKVGGISAEYNLSWGWCLPYPEVSGYIIPTLLNLSKYLPEEKSQIEIRTKKIAYWLLSIQHQDGSYDSGWYYDRKIHGNRPLAQRVVAMGKPLAFETGQIIWGLSAIYEHTQKAVYLESAIRAADWLVKQQSSEGTWVEAQGVPTSFSALTARHLASLAKITGYKRYEESAIRNCDWCLSKQNSAGWLDECSHDLGSLPWTHGIGYATQGLLETGLLLHKDEYISGAIKTADALLKVYSLRDNGLLPARFDDSWGSGDRFTCMVGDAQISLVWSILYKATKDTKYLDGALKINDEMKSLQILESSNGGIVGGVKGSHPIWGYYKMFSYPAWAVKFFIDALLEEESVG